MTDRAPERRSWRERGLTRLLHIYFALSRGMTLGVRAACFDSEGRIFLVRHGYIAGWHLPGGGVERGETALEALAKEMREEGHLVKGDAPELFHVYFNSRTAKRDHVLLYLCRNVVQTGPRIGDREIVECGFFAPDRLPAETTAATHRRLAEIAGVQAREDIW